MIVIQIVFGVIGFTIQIGPSDESILSSAIVVASESNEKSSRPSTLSSVDADAELPAKAEIDDSLPTVAFEDLGKPDASSSKSADSKTSNGKSPTLATDALAESSTPLLNENAPAWIRDGLSKEGDELRFPIATSLHSDVEECRNELDSVLISEVRDYLEKNVLIEGVSAGDMAGLTTEYIKKKLLVPEREYVNIVDRPSGSYHQLWRQIFISKSELAVIRGWEKNREVLERTKQVGLMGGSALLGMTLLSGMVGLLARREKAKLKG
jgi:hypothetical protein